MLIQQADTSSSSSCGDIAYVRGFHLIEKKAGKWLWSTYWWNPDDPDATSYSLKNDVTDEPWKNYAMQAQLQSTGPYETMYNPWKPDELPGSNCQVCHSGAKMPNPPRQLTTKSTPPKLPAGSIFFDFIFAGPQLNPDY
jgi:hypothetical protein